MAHRCTLDWTSWKRTSGVELLGVALAVVVLWCWARSAAEHSTPIILLPCRTVQSLVGLPLVSAQRSADLVSQGAFHHAVVAHVRCGTPRTLLLSSFAAAAAPPRSSFPPRSVTVGQPSRRQSTLEAGNAAKNTLLLQLLDLLAQLQTDRKSGIE